MPSEPTTLYKLMILYMLKQVNFPITNNQLSDFFLGYEYTTYFVIQEVLTELLEANLINMDVLNNASRYTLTSYGVETLALFGKQISSAIIDDMDTYLKDNKYSMRNEIGTYSDYYKNETGDYILHCSVREGKNILIDIDLSIPDEVQTKHMCNKWKDVSQDIYQYIMKKLMN